MFRPSGSALIGMTLAPAARYARGAATDAAPWAQSTTTVSVIEPGGGGLADVAQIALQGVLGIHDTADARAGRAGTGALVHEFLDAVLGGVVELVPAGAEDLDAVVGHRVVRRGDHHAEIGVIGAGQVGHRRRGQHTDAEGVDALAGDPGDDGGFEHLAAGARITADHGDPSAGLTRPAEPSGGRPPRAIANSAVSSWLATPRTPSVPNSRAIVTTSHKSWPRANSAPVIPPCRRRNGSPPETPRQDTGGECGLFTSSLGSGRCRRQSSGRCPFGGADGRRRITAVDGWKSPVRRGLPSARGRAARRRSGRPATRRRRPAPSAWTPSVSTCWASATMPPGTPPSRLRRCRGRLSGHGVQERLPPTREIHQTVRTRRRRPPLPWAPGPPKVARSPFRVPR